MCPFTSSSWLILIAAISTMSSASPGSGMRTTISQKGLDEIMEEIDAIVRKDIVGKNFGSFSGDGELSYKFSNIVLQSIEGVKSSVNPQNNHFLRWSFYIAKTRIVSSWSIKYKAGIPWGSSVTVFSDSGTLTVDIHKASVIFSLNVGALSGKPNISLGKCTSNVGNIDIDFSGTILSSIYEAIVEIFDSKLEKMLEDEICRASKNALNDMSDDMMSLQTLTSASILDIPLSFDYSITELETGKDFITAFHRGMFRLQNSDATFPDIVNVFPTLSRQTHMLSLFLREEIINSFLQISVRENLLNGEMNTKNEDLNANLDLNLGCHSSRSVCVGTLLPQASQTYPNATVYIHGNIQSASVQVKPGSFTAILKGRVYFQADTGSQDVTLFSAELTLETLMQLGMSHNTLAFRVIDMKGRLVVDESNIGKVITDSLKFVFNIAKSKLLQALKKTINNWSTSFVISLPKDVSIEKSMITLFDGIIGIDIDVCYKRACQSNGTIAWVPTTLDDDFAELEIEDVIATPKPAIPTSTIRSHTTTEQRFNSTHPQPSGEHSVDCGELSQNPLPMTRILFLLVIIFILT